MIASGTEVFWTQTDYSGNAVRVVKTNTCGIPFKVTRSDGSIVELVTLKCLRVAPMTQISLTDPGVLPIQNGKRKTDSRTVPTEMESGETNRQSRSQTAKPANVELEPKESASKPAVRPSLSEGTCNVLAIDFLNVLVRAWHAGKPTEVHAVRSLFQTVANSIRTLKPAHVVFAMDGGHDLRSSILPQYKAHRPPSEPGLTAQKQLAEQALQIAGFQTIRIQGWEADDVLASLAQSHSDTVIVSSDKDLLTMTGCATRCRIFHPWKDGAFVTPEEKIGLPAGQITDFLALCGDASDGIPGVNGIGEKTAVKLLQEFDSLEGILTAATLGQIKGAIGVKIKEQRETALLCRRVVELNRQLPLPELAERRPQPDWQKRLQALQLGSVAAIVESLSGQRVNRDATNEENTTTRSESPELSAPIGQGEQSGRDESTSDQRRLQPVQPSRAIQPESKLPSESVVPAEPVSRRASTHPADGSAAIRITRSITEPFRENLSYAQRWDGPDHGLIMCWEAGRGSAGRSSENPWKPQTPNWTAWKQGSEGLDLNVLWVPPQPEKPVSQDKPPQHVPPVKRRTAGSLF
jgi:DNA polymerase-1